MSESNKEFIKTEIKKDEKRKSTAEKRELKDKTCIFESRRLRRGLEKSIGNAAAIKRKALPSAPPKILK